MKKGLLLIIVIISLFLVSACESTKYQYKEYVVASDTSISTIKDDTALEGKELFGLLSVDKQSLKGYPAGTYYVLYKDGDVPAGSYYLVYKDAGSTYLPEVNIKGLSFSGWYENGKRVSASNSTILYARYINLLQAALIVAVCILIVFLMLILLSIIVKGFKLIVPKAKVKEAKEKRIFTMEDITDEDMMVAALIASIDYHNECKKDVRVVAIKEI